MTVIAKPISLDRYVDALVRPDPRAAKAVVEGLVDDGQDIRSPEQWLSMEQFLARDQQAVTPSICPSCAANPVPALRER